MDQTVTINIAKDFSKWPAGRFDEDGPFPGEKFRDEFLLPALSSGKSVIVELDGTRGYGSSFLEEAFGGLVRLGKLTREQLHSVLKFVSNDDPTLPMEIWSYIDAEVVK
jgi:hypothetical protein